MTQPAAEPRCTCGYDAIVEAHHRPWCDTNRPVALEQPAVARLDEITAILRGLARTMANIGAQGRSAFALAPPPAEGQEQPERGEFWSLLDWSLWGSGMGDIFREPLADAMVAALTPEQLRQAEELMEAWHASGRQPLGRRRYEELEAERKAAVDRAEQAETERDTAVKAYNAVTLQLEVTQAEAKRLAIMVDEYGQGASQLADKVTRVRARQAEWATTGEQPDAYITFADAAAVLLEDLDGPKPPAADA